MIELIYEYHIVELRKYELDRKNIDRKKSLLNRKEGTFLTK